MCTAKERNASAANAASSACTSSTSVKFLDAVAVMASFSLILTVFALPLYIYTVLLLGATTA